MSILGIPILSFLGCPARTRDHFNQAVETIKFCRELQYRVDYSDPAQVERLEEVLSKAEQALKNAISAPTDLALFLDFRNTVKEKYSKDQSEILQGFDNRWIEAEKQDGRKNRIFKKGSRSGEREMLISFVNPGVKTFNFANVPEKSKTTVIVRCRRTDTIEGLLWLFTRERSTHRADIGSSLKMLYFSHFYESEALQKLDESPVKRATVTHVDPIGPSLPQDRCRLLRLLWDRGPSFHFEVASSNSSKISYGNIWRLGDYNDSAFVLKGNAL
ncbi:hypothetical protein L218DRAFT_966424 [Marasmius fiardii PR-910]|nr:hypothetical protein L218DRAFT_966424 [Marasmius fiardii PR-910]